MSTPHHSALWAMLLTAQGTSGTHDHLSRSIANSRVDLNPHQVDAALFALRSPLSHGVLLADEVGLGKTIEAGLVLAQRWAERKRRILIIVPAILRSQWQQELEQKFFLPCRIQDSRSWNAARRPGSSSPFDIEDSVQICSYHFASSKAEDLARIPWDLVVIDEAHRLRNVYKPRHSMARVIADAIRSAPKLLLTATPLQNSLLELFGLVSVIDDQVFGDEGSFREQFVRAPDETVRDNRLRERLRPLCARTLRKQVGEYVRFTRRVPITQDFYPSDEEQRLYETVSAYLQRPDLQALPAQQREFMILVLRKLLASSTFALGPTLRSLADRLDSELAEQALLDDEDLEGAAELAEELQEDQPSSQDDAIPPEGPGEASGSAVVGGEPSPADVLRAEIAELRRLADVASSIGINAKGEALLPALNAAFARAKELGAPRKAVIFTESRRTQTYLFELLSRRGFEGQIALLNGTNTDPLSRQIHEVWASKRPAEAPRESRTIAVKTAIVEHFRDHASILIATEAAAEGINLQFCSLVVNYDLPWNPQRIEQRIGRCHRYGQKHDVVVVIFLNRRNAADQRVFQLLAEKLRLFGGVFGASDEILGALESGVDIERRIAEVYRTCRTTVEIEAAFDRLQAELDEQIQARLRETRSALLEHFDEEVAARLRIHKDKTLELLSHRERWLLELTRFELGPEARFDADRPRFEFTGAPSAEVPRGHYHFDWKEAERLGDVFYRQDHPLAARLVTQADERALDSATLVFQYSGRDAVISAVKPLIGRSGWLALARLRVHSVDSSEFTVLAGRIEDSQGTSEMDEELCLKLFQVPARQERSEHLRASLSNELETAVAARMREVEQRNGRLFDEEVGKLDRWSADLKDGLEREIREADREIQEATREAALTQALAGKVQAQRRVRELEGVRTKKRRELFEAQDAVDRQRGELIGKMERQLACRSEVVERFTVRWMVV